ncbi:hypothetical protein ALO79_200265 [Pseudomonas syringae pv. castaneae]|uniref:Uncharacterized protein n=1 Tax=Pseudomonas syringae pv. castaneae TaxID=264450 RepID=A0A0P9N3H1_PSESX|nr:hypothetical protein ALO79_200265 [Pseudomonas syringae pv. castaneae]
MITLAPPFKAGSIHIMPRPALLKISPDMRALLSQTGVLNLSMIWSRQP